MPGTAYDVTLTMAWNPAGQVTSRTISNGLYVYAPANGNTPYAIDGRNEIASSGSTTFSYDANRNLTNDGASSFTYDAGNRLLVVRASTPYPSTLKWAMRVGGVFMRRINRFCAAALTLVTLGSYGCISPSDRPFLMVQVCLGDEEAVSRFKNILHSASTQRGMEFNDYSEWSTENRRESRLRGSGADFSYPAISVRSGDPNEFGLLASNLGLSPYEVGIGFWAQSNVSEAEAFAGDIVAELEREWAVHVVPDGQGSRPLEECAAI